MKHCKKNENPVRMTYDATTKTVTIEHCTAHNTLDKGLGFQYTNHFTLKDLTESELAFLATESLVIKARARYNFRGHENPDTLDNRTFDAKKLLPSKKKEVLPGQVLAKFSKEQIEEYLASLQEQE